MNQFFKRFAFDQLVNSCLLLLTSSNVMAQPQPQYSQEWLQEKAQALGLIADHTIQSLQTASSEELTPVIQEPPTVTFNVYPITTPNLTPGQVTPRAMVLTKLVQPIFLVGTDDLSKQWLIQNADRLNQLKAVGFVVQAENQAEVDALSQSVPDTVLLPLSASEFAARWHLDHYPVLITAQGISQ